jgi:hypothetical protein
MSGRTISWIALASSAAILAASPVRAEMTNTPACQHDMAAANRLIEAIQARDKDFVAGDLATNCRLLRQNLADMVKAREPMNRCLTGHEHGETVGQMDDSIADIRSAIANKCAK